ncbi:serine-rich adhesin for platelets-like [Macrobrachium nipponense]|uniref:serine-rich adhesin for platelets-like n=1 Tax=Macrobrachium nipponense TaxID=159736 RepID=UPI0030C80D03
MKTEEDNGMAGFLTSAKDDSFEIRKRNLTTESSASSLATVVSAEHLNEPDSSSHSNEEDTFIEESFSSTSDQVSTNLLDSCTSMSSVESNKEQPCSVEEQLSKTPKCPSELRESISSEYNETDALVSVTVAPSVEIQGEHTANDISLYKETFIGKENSSECHESSTYTEQSKDSSFLEYQQHKAGSCEALESEKEADTSVNSSSFSDQNLDANNLVSASPVIEETNEETSSTGSCILLNVQEKGLFDEDIFFQNIRHKLQAKERKLLSRERNVSSIAEDFSDEENLCLLDYRNDNQTVTSIDDGDQFMIIIDVSESANVKELQLEVVGNNAVLIKGSAVTNGAEQDDVKTFSERLDLPVGIDVESGHCATSEDGVLVIAFSKVTSASAERISTDDTKQICISGDECSDYGEMMPSTSVETINTSDTDCKDFMKSVMGGHRASCGVDTSSQTKRSAERNLSAEVTGFSGDVNDSLTIGHSTNNNTKQETIEDTSDTLDVGLKFDERCDGTFSVQGSNEKGKGHILKTSCELNQTLQRGLDNSGNVPSLDSHNEMEDFTKEGFSGTFNTERASCFVSDSSLRISEEEKATTSNEETSANEGTLMMERREDEFSNSIGGDEVREMQENINITSFKHNHLSSSQEEEEEHRSAKDYEENKVSSSRANGRMLLRKDSDESVGDLEYQKELEELSCVAEKAVKGYFCPENYVTLKLQEKGLFAEDAFFESVRLHLLVEGGETWPNSGGLSSVSDELTSTKKLYCIDHLDQNKVATFIEDEDYYTIILDVSCYSEKERVKVSVIEEKELSVEYSCVASDCELELMKTFSTRFVLPSGIDSGSGLCGISSDGILAAKFSKQKHSSCHKLERREDAGETQNCLNVEENLAYTTHFLQNRDCISSEAKSDIVGVGDSKEFTSKTFSRFKIHSDSSDIQEHNIINVTMLPFIKRGHFFHDSFFTEAQRLLQEAIKKVLMQSSEEETCRHSSDIKTYKCLRKQNPTWQNQAFHLEEDQYGYKVLLDAESLNEGSTVVYVLEGTELVIECQLETKGGSSHSLQTCKRSFSLPPNVDVNEATSALSSDGVLYIVFSKRDIP